MRSVVMVMCFKSLTILSVVMFASNLMVANMIPIEAVMCVIKACLLR